MNIPIKLMADVLEAMKYDTQNMCAVWNHKQKRCVYSVGTAPDNHDNDGCERCELYSDFKAAYDTQRTTRINVLVHLHGGLLESVTAFESDEEAENAWEWATGIPWKAHQDDPELYEAKFSGGSDEYKLEYAEYRRVT